MQLLRYLCMCTPWNVCLFLQCKQILRMQLLGFLNKYKQECLNEYGCVARMSSSAYLRFVRIQVYGSKAGDIYVCIYTRIYFSFYIFFLSFLYFSLGVFEYLPIKSCLLCDSDSKYFFSKKSDNTLFFYIHLFFVSICTQHVRKKEILYERKNVRQKYLNITFKDKKYGEKKMRWQLTCNQHMHISNYSLLKTHDTC